MDFTDLVEVKIRDPESFLVIKETLSRIGIASKKSNILFQSCHILHKQGKYAITHFKELFLLDGKNTGITEEDINRRNTIINLLAQWNLISVVKPELLNGVMSLSLIKIVKFGDKSKWTFVQKYNCGAVKGKPLS